MGEACGSSKAAETQEFRDSSFRLGEHDERKERENGAQPLVRRPGGRRAIVAEISERNVLVAIVAHLKWPTEALPLARARSPAFEGGRREPGRPAASPARAEVRREG